VAQAIHWFDFDKFFAEVKRILKPGGIVAVIGYGLLEINEEIDAWINHFYTGVIGSYWDKERRYIDEEYKTIPFPFHEINSPALTMEYSWRKDQFVGFLNSWSAVEHYIKQQNATPLTSELMKQLDAVWPNDTIQKVRFPLFLRVGIK
jgi:hypothetical protein